MIKERNIIFHGQYFQNFYLRQTKKVQVKIGYVFKIIKTVEFIPVKFLKHIEGTDGLYEIRIESGNDKFRVFCCFEKGNNVVLLNSFKKKSQKTPKRELILAEKL